MTVVAAILTTGAFSQSNEQGTIQIGLGYLVTLGGGTLKSDPGTSVDVTGARGMYGLRAQYGLADNLSAGIFVRAEAATYVVSDLTNLSALTGTNLDITYSGTSFGLEGKYYLANSDNFNFYPAVSVGYTTADNEFGGFQLAPKYTISGINYSVGVGLNWYFVAEVFGLSFDLDYAGSSLSGTQPADAVNGPLVETKNTLTNGSINWGFGLTAHFGGK